MIYLDNAATSLRRPEGVVRAVSEALCSLGNVGRGASESALSAARGGDRHNRCSRAHRRAGT